jgi:hypothetical protein
MLAHAPLAPRPDLKKIVTAIEAIHDIRVESTEDGQFTIPYQIFKLRPPALVDIRPATNDLILKVKKDKSLVLNIALITTRSSKDESFILF